MKLEYIFIKTCDDYYSSEESLKNFLSVNKRLSFKQRNSASDILLFDEKELSFLLQKNDVEKSDEVIFRLMIEAAGDEIQQVKVLEELDELLKEINKQFGKPFSINTIWNDVSLYYGRKLYPAITEVENKLRKIIYLFMLKTVGSNWIKTNAPEKVQKDIKGVIEKNNKDEEDIQEEWLTYADFITLGYFLTVPYALKPDVRGLLNRLKQYEYNDVDSENKSEERLTSDILKQLSEEYEPKSNWDRYFSDSLQVKTSGRFMKEWSSLYNIRNMVAHGKPIKKEDFDKAQNLIKKFSGMFDECIDMIDTLKVTDDEAEAVGDVAKQMLREPIITFSVKKENEFESLNIIKAYLKAYRERLNPVKDITYFERFMIRNDILDNNILEEDEEKTNLQDEDTGLEEE